MIARLAAFLAAFGITGACFVLLALWSDRIGPALDTAKRRRLYRRMRKARQQH